jgi:hypothetical protein
VTAFDDPLRLTLLLFPVSAALSLFAARSLGARRGATPLEVVLWSGWVLLALHVDRLSLAGSDELVLAFGAILAAVRAVALVPALGRFPEAEGGGRRRTLAAFAAALAFLLFLWPSSRAGRAPDGDEPYYLLLTESLVSDFDVDLADEYRDGAWAKFSEVAIEPQPGDPEGPSGERWSRHTALLPLLLAPLYVALGVPGAELGMILLAAALVAAIFAAARAASDPGDPGDLCDPWDRREGLRGAARVWALALVAPPLFVYSGRFWVEVPAALAVALALGAIARLEREASDRAHAPEAGVRRRAWWILAGALAALPLLKLRFAAIALPLLAVALFRLRRRPRGAWIAAAFAGVLAALALWNLARFGNPLRMYGSGELDPTAMSLRSLARGLDGLALDVAYGLFATSPIWLLLAPALPRLRRGTLAFAALAAALPYLAFVAGRREWYGGWSPPFRYGVVLLPLLALPLAPFLAERHAGTARRLLVATLAAATAGLALVAFLHPAWTFSLADGLSRPLAELSQIHAGDLARFTPSAVRPRLATWLWLLAIPAAMALARRSSKGRFAARRTAAPVAVALLLLAFAGWLHAAGAVPTRLVEVEDGWVDKRGGGLFPGPWTIDRTRFDGGWNLIPGQEISFVPVAGGSSLVFEVRATRYGVREEPLALELLVGERLLATFSSPDEIETPRSFMSDVAPFRAGERVFLRATRPAGLPDGPGATHWVVDRLRLDWR